MTDQKKQEFSEDRGNMELASLPEKRFPVKTLTDNDNVDFKGSRIYIGKLILSTMKDRHEKHYKESKFHLIADLVLASIILILATALIWSRFWQPAKNIYLESRIDGKAVSGQERIIEIEYANRNGEEIEESNITLVLPESFILESQQPDNLYDANTKTFRIGNLASGANGKIILKGVIMGSVGTRDILMANFNFKKAGQQLKVLNSLIYTIEGSALETSIDLPAEVYQGAELAGKIRIKNNSDRDIRAIGVVFDERLWELEDSDDNVIDVEVVKGGEAREIGFTAIPVGPEGGNELNVRQTIVYGSEKFDQGSISTPTNIIKPKLKISLDNRDKCLKIGDEADFAVSYENGEADKVEDLRMIIASGNPDLAITGINISNVGIKRENNDIFLGDLDSGQKGNFEVSIKFDRKNISFNAEADFIVRIEYKLAGKNVKYQVRSDKIKTLSNLNVRSVAYYYSPQGDQLGIGPLPPVVDIPTRYWIFWEADNSGNDFKNLSLAAYLPANINWTDNKSLSAGSMQFIQGERKVVWTVKDISKEGGNYRTGFEVELIPVANDIGKTLELLTGTKFTSQDTFCIREIGGNLKNLTTNLDFDRLGTGKGKIIN